MRARNLVLETSGSAGLVCSGPDADDAGFSVRPVCLWASSVFSSSRSVANSKLDF